MTTPLTGAALTLFRFIDSHDVGELDAAEQLIRDVIAEAKAEEREAIASYLDGVADEETHYGEWEDIIKHVRSGEIE